MNKKIRIGFDLDGVILYNPARIIRPFISLLKKKHLVKRKQLQFFVPKNKWQEIMWYWFHKSSIFPAAGIKEVKNLVNQGQIEAYIITARFAHLKPDFERWQKRIKAKDTFKECYLNEQNEQPHLFKEKMIRKLKLDIFIEDNADIVNYLAQRIATKKLKQKTRVYWVTNIFDQRLAYPYKFLSLKQVINHIKGDVLKIK